jgi:hypothetical protein
MIAGIDQNFIMRICVSGGRKSEKGGKWTEIFFENFLLSVGKKTSKRLLKLKLE